ncbi:MAG: acyltransferase family protein [Ruminococcus flavefaciens]|nr:acyltransferase family protein [Ruminococcus flavefaciens]
MKKTMDKRKNIVYLEVLRIVAIFCVLFNHTNTKGFFLFARTDSQFDYVISILLSVLCKTAVPLFFMISGYLLLGKKESFPEVIKKRVVKYALVIAAASLLTYAVGCLVHKESFHVRELTKIVYRGDIGTYWFLYAYLGLMLMLPFLRGIAGVLSGTMVYYLVGLKILLRGLLPIAIFILLGYSMSPALEVTMLEDPLFYFLTGFYFGTAENIYDSVKKRLICRGVSCVCVMATCGMLYYEYKVTGSYTENFLGALLPIVCITIFSEARYYLEHKKISDAAAKVILFVGDKTLGVYLLEPVFRTCIGEMWNRLTEGLPPLPVSLLWCLLVFAAGTFVTWLLKWIPGVRRLL